MRRRDLLTAAAGSLLRTGKAEKPTRPNILFILMDDMAQRALSSFGNPLVKTPHIDRLASEGVRFTDAYVTPQCTPTRATLLTGQYTARNRMWHVIPWYGYPWARLREPPFRESLTRDEFLLPKGLAAAGYSTACIGKWHLTNNADGNYNGLKNGAPYGFDVVTKPPPGPDELRTGDKGVRRLTDEAIDFIERNRKGPFFCYLPHHTIHGPVTAPDAIVRKYRDAGAPAEGLHNATYLAAIEYMDTCIGRLLGALDDMKLAGSTAVVFLTDNGGVFEALDPKPVHAGNAWRLQVQRREFANTPLRAGKGSGYEGGSRVPMIVRWPGVTKPGAVSRTPVHAVDIMPTFFEMAGAKAPPGHIQDGVSIAPLLRGGRIARRALFGYTPFYELRWAVTPSAQVRDGKYKLIESFGDWRR
ncbi:MAG: sulfatase [Bryobacteraceae bacterium]